MMVPTSFAAKAVWGQRTAPLGLSALHRVWEQGVGLSIRTIVVTILVGHWERPVTSRAELLMVATFTMAVGLVSAASSSNQNVVAARGPVFCIAMKEQIVLTITCSAALGLMMQVTA